MRCSQLSPCGCCGPQGDAGVLVKQSDEMVSFTNCHWGFNQYCTNPASMVWKKLLDGGKVARPPLTQLSVAHFTCFLDYICSAQLPGELLQ